MRLLKFLGISFLIFGLIVIAIFANWHWKSNDPHSCAFYAYHYQKKAISIEYNNNIYHFRYIPQCTIFGNYLTEQDLHSTGYSFCVDNKGGVIPHTLVEPSKHQSLPCRNLLAKIFNDPLVEVFLLPANSQPFMMGS
jgi:hypothetical protein